MRNKQNKIKYLFAIVVMGAMLFSSAAQASEITPEKIVELLNEAREENNLPGLLVNPVLEKVARAKLNDMIENEYFAHTSPDGVSPWNWFSKEGYDYKFAGENLAISFLSAEKQQAAWMKSPTHRKNILNSEYLEVGAAVGAGEIDGIMSIIAVSEFGAQPNGIISDKSFSVGDDEGLIKKDGQIVPQVLSGKDVSFEKTTSGILPNSQSGLTMIDGTMVFFIFLLLASLSLIPLVFLSVATEKIWLINEKEREEKRSKKEEVYA